MTIRSCSRCRDRGEEWSQAEDRGESPEQALHALTHATGNSRIDRRGPTLRTWATQIPKRSGEPY